MKTKRLTGKQLRKLVESALDEAQPKRKVGRATMKAAARVKKAFERAVSREYLDLGSEHLIDSWRIDHVLDDVYGIIGPPLSDDADENLVTKIAQRSIGREVRAKFDASVDVDAVIDQIVTQLADWRNDDLG